MLNFSEDNAINYVSMNNDEHLENEYENVEDEQVVNETDNGLNKIVNSEEDIAD